MSETQITDQASQVKDYELAAARFNAISAAWRPLTNQLYALLEAVGAEYDQAHDALTSVTVRGIAAAAMFEVSADEVAKFEIAADQRLRAMFPWADLS